MMDTFLINLGYGLMLMALIARDILWLRSILVTAQSCLSIYGWMIGNDMMMTWNAAFVLINSVQVIRIMMERRPITLSDEQEPIYQAVFSSLSRREFLVFWEMGSMKTKESGTFVREGETPQELMLLVEGEVDVQSKGATLARLSRGQFIAEMSFISDMPASADVTVRSPSRYLAWSQQKLRSMRQVNPHLFIVLQGLLGKDLVGKIRALNRTHQRSN